MGRKNSFMIRQFDLGAT